MIVSSNTVNEKSNLLIFTMYTSMHALLDQREAHQSCAADTRKIILCTDVAESCISVSDACHVIDAGRTSRGARVSTRTSQLRASAVARNRSGICFHLFPRSEDLPNSSPQLLCSPLYQLALQIKLLGGSESVAEFFHRLPQPPHSSAIQHAVHILKTIDALDESENISELGQH
uniref:Helicase C-terminal domain-containing protein n=1 Tax=Ciona savignyi TaxID=51511 RepID=H2ZCW9_CIOSA